MTRERFYAILIGEQVPTSDPWRVWAAELFDLRERSGGQLEVVSVEGEEAGLRALLRVKLAKGLEHEVTPEDIAAQVEADPALAAAIEP